MSGSTGVESSFTTLYISAVRKLGECLKYGTRSVQVYNQTKFGKENFRSEIEVAIKGFRESYQLTFNIGC